AYRTDELAAVDETDSTCTVRLQAQQPRDQFTTTDLNRRFDQVVAQFNHVAARTRRLCRKRLSAVVIEQQIMSVRAASVLSCAVVRFIRVRIIERAQHGRRQLLAQLITFEYVGNLVRRL